jgi:hypothetical protein
MKLGHALLARETVKVRAERDRSYLMKAPITPEID